MLSIRTIVFHLLILVQPLAGFAQGLVPANREEYESIPLYDARTLTYEMSVPYMADGTVKYGEVEHTYTVNAKLLPDRVDLSDFLPAPGKQAGKDCVGWSVAYAIYSQAVARQRNNIPDETHEIFSPRFLYTQISNGADVGAAIYSTNPTTPNAIATIKKVGCATLRTAPYGLGPAQWLSSPLSKQAFIEASNYKAVSHSRLGSLVGIKEALASQLPVVLAIRVDQELESPQSNGVYHFSGNTKGYHALIAAGYDDTLEAIKVMNSWGAQWKDGGFCWIHYDGFSALGRDEFCLEAYLIQLADEALPRVIASTSFRMQLGENLSIYDINDGAPTLLGSPSNNGQVKASSEDIYLVDVDGVVHVWAEFVDDAGQVVERDWFNISTGALPQGLGSIRATMLAGIPKAIYILGSDGKVYGRAEGQHIRDSSWEKLPLPGGKRCIDVRERKNQIFATSIDGDVYLRRPGVGWTALTATPTGP